MNTISPTTPGEQGFAQAQFDKRQLREVLGSFVTGVTVITTVGADGKLHGLTANSFSSVSLDPPLVLWSQVSSAASHPVFREASHFAVNILAEDQFDVANRFAKAATDKFLGLETDIGIGGVPILRDCSAWLECRVESRLPGGDHTIFVGAVERIRRGPRRPLVFGGGQYLVADPHDLGSPPVGTQGAMKSQPHAARLAVRAMLRLSRELNVTLALVAWGNHGPTVIAWQASGTPIAADLPLGLVLPVISSASGLTFAAYLPREATDRFAAAEMADAELQQADWPRDYDELERVLDDVRRDGIATRKPGNFHGDSTTVNALSVPILTRANVPVLALTALGIVDTFDVDPNGPLAGALRRAALEMSAQLDQDTEPASSGW